MELVHGIQKVIEKFVGRELTGDMVMLGALMCGLEVLLAVFLFGKLFRRRT